MRRVPGEAEKARRDASGNPLKHTPTGLYRWGFFHFALQGVQICFCGLFGWVEDNHSGVALLVAL